jgi:hypothetical protein
MTRKLVFVLFFLVCILGAVITSHYLVTYKVERMLQDEATIGRIVAKVQKQVTQKPVAEQKVVQKLEPQPTPRTWEKYWESQRN